MASEYKMPRTDLHGWRLKVGEDNHGQHKWVYLPDGPAREAWPQTKMDKYAIGLEMVCSLLPLRSAWYRYSCNYSYSYSCSYGYSVPRQAVGRQVHVRLIDRTCQTWNSPRRP